MFPGIIACIIAVIVFSFAIRAIYLGYIEEIKNVKK